MEASNVRKEIHEYVDHADQRFLALVYSMVQADQQGEDLNPTIKEKLTSRALKSEQNIKDGKIYSRQEAESKLRSQLGL